MNHGQSRLVAGMEALKRKDFAQAEVLLMAAYRAFAPQQNLPPGVIDPRFTVCFGLGSVCRRTNRFDEAIRLLEMALPLPAAFKELVSMYRGFAKRMEKDGDEINSAEWYRRMFCLAKISATVLTIRVADVPVSVDWGRASRWLEEMRRQCGSLYAYQFDGNEIHGDDLLTATDYKALHAFGPG